MNVTALLLEACDQESQELTKEMKDIWPDQGRHLGSWQRSFITAIFNYLKKYLQNACSQSLLFNKGSKMFVYQVLLQESKPGTKRSHRITHFSTKQE